MPYVTIARLALLPALLIMSGANAAAQPPLTGDWGNFQVRATLGEAGGTVEFDCATASIDAPVRPDGDGKFTAAGRLQAFTPGPDRSGDTAPVFTPARFDGRVDGQTLHLSMRTAGADKAQQFTLRRGMKVKIIRCM